jgi:hypothetical protein
MTLSSQARSERVVLSGLAFPACSEIGDKTE